MSADSADHEAARTGHGKQVPSRRNRYTQGRLEGKVALVTGGASGIGRAIARRFVSEGASVAAGDLDEKGLDALADELGDRCTGVTGDATVEDDQARFVAAALDRFGRLDIAVANAGTGHLARIVDQDLADWRRILDVCLTGVFLTIKHAGRAMAAGDGGSIITMASLNAVQPAAGMSAYCAAKSGVTMLTEVAAMELGPSVRVNSIGPGLVQTQLTEAMWHMPGLVDEFVENTTVGRFAEPDDIAKLALFLASDDASFISGSLYLADGGGHTRRYPDMFGSIARLADPPPPAESSPAEPPSGE
jgi:NAD(P)-dependent dehydrogenase (short-subunit alcohol dehydrogenase family)